MNKEILTSLAAMGLICADYVYAQPATFDIKTEKLHIPMVEVVLKADKVGAFEVEMQLVPGDAVSDFTISKVTPLDSISSTDEGSSLVPPAPNGIVLPEGYKDWRIVAPSHRTDNNTLRVILGNDAAIQAAREGKTNPWPDGAILAKLVWKDASLETWSAATVPGAFVHAEFMIKNAEQYAQTGGWGFARWLGTKQKPHGENASFVQGCFGCHTPVKDNDYVFTQPAILP